MADYDNPTIDQMLDGIFTAYLDANANVVSALLPLVRARNESEMQRYMIFHSATYYAGNAGATLVTNPTEYFTNGMGFDDENREKIAEMAVGEVISVGLGVDVARLPDKFKVGDLVRKSERGSLSMTVTRTDQLFTVSTSEGSVIANDKMIKNFVKTGTADDDQMKQALWSMALDNLETLVPSNVTDKPKAPIDDTEKGTW